MQTKVATTDYPINGLLTQRWSPYTFSEAPVLREELGSLFEAARWTASSYNEQPWRYVVALRQEADQFARLLSCLVEANQVWARQAGALALGFFARSLAKNGKPNEAAQHDLGAAGASLTIEATSRGLQVHQMIGIIPERARELYGVPQEFQALTALAIGYPGSVDNEPEELRKRDQATRTRKPLDELIFEGNWGQAAGLGLTDGQQSGEQVSEWENEGGRTPSAPAR